MSTPPPFRGSWGGSRMQFWTGVWDRSAPTSSLRMCGTLWSRPSTARGSGISMSSGSGRTGKVVRGATRWVSQQVQRIVQALRGAGVYEETADPPPSKQTPSLHPRKISRQS